MWLWINTICRAQVFAWKDLVSNIAQRYIGMCVINIHYSRTIASWSWKLTFCHVPFFIDSLIYCSACLLKTGMVWITLPAGILRAGMNLTIRTLTHSTSQCKVLFWPWKLMLCQFCFSTWYVEHEPALAVLAVHCIALGIEQPNPSPCLFNSTAGCGWNGPLKLHTITLIFLCRLPKLLWCLCGGAEVCTPLSADRDPWRSLQTLSQRHLYG